MAARVDQELIEQADPVAARPAEVGQAPAEERRRGQPVTDRAVDGSFEITERLGAGEVDDGPSGGGAHERSHRSPIDGIQAVGGVHVPAGSFTSRGARDRELDGPGSEPVEAVQRRRCPAGDDRAVPGVSAACSTIASSARGAWLKRK